MHAKLKAALSSNPIVRMNAAAMMENSFPDLTLPALVSTAAAVNEDVATYLTEHYLILWITTYHTCIRHRSLNIRRRWMACFYYLLGGRDSIN